MRKILTALVAAASIAAAAVPASSTAEARWGWGPGAVIGGLAAGAIIGGAIAARPYYYGDPYYAYGGYPYAVAPGCVWRRVWNGYAWVRACVAPY